MSELRRLPLASIVIPNKRLRELDEDQARAMAASIKENGQLHPIAAYRSSAAARPYTLIFGLHRYRAHQILELEEIDVIIRSASEAPMLEVAENLFRHDLTELDRAAFTAEWFKLKGVKMGRPKKSDNVADFLEKIGLTDRAAKELGFSGRTGRRLRRIADHIIAPLKEALRGTAAANNQTLLLKLAKLPHEEQRRIAAALAHEPDVKKVLKLVQPEKGRKDETQLREDVMRSTWRIMSAAQREAFLADIGAMMKPTEIPTKEAT